MALTIILGISALIISLFVGAAILLGLEKLFKISNSTYKNSLIILIILGIANFVISIIFGIFIPVIAATILTTIAIFFVFHFLLKKYYLAKWTKSLGIFSAFIIVIFLITIAIILPIRAFVVQPFVVRQSGMNPILNDGDFVLINKLDKKFSRNDIIVFRYPADPSQYFIKRIIGLPNEKIEIKNGQVFLNDQLLNEDYISKQETLGNISITLNKNQYFILGDDRNTSLDSRTFGPISLDAIEGKAVKLLK
jgi:signal peptidase I